MSLLDNIFVNLRVLSKIPEGGRISTTGTGQIKLEDTRSLGGWMATGRRKITGDSRDECVKVLMQLVNDVTEISDNIINSLVVAGGGSSGTQSTSPDTGAIGLLNENSKKCHQLNKLCSMLENANKGIVNLHQTTYNDDVNVTAKLDEVMDKMTQQRQRISQVLKYVNAAHTRDLEQLRSRFHLHPVSTADAQQPTTAAPKRTDMPQTRFEHRQAVPQPAGPAPSHSSASEDDDQEVF